ncbi:MAG: hypothetical protein KME42_16705 [Tildeniella nuda ZEHNDER 1965/U140]|jgi:ABC-type transport system involved in cytochrome c biogenesis permease subunit|nr:hypothetical protein [Tildeniella nuda ZEHNDER 1965/U140]
MTPPDNVWTHKPWWCQPWSILLTGFALIGGSWGLLRIVWLTVIVAIPVLTWMGFFLLVYPRLMMQNGALPDGVSSDHE